MEKGIQTCTYQVQLRHADFPGPLNVVILVKTNLTTQAWVHVLLFSSDLQLSCKNLVQPGVNTYVVIRRFRPTV